MKMIGGKQVLEDRLDELFTANAETSGRDQADITGLIGQYAHGNEPSHHMAYLYNFAGKPHKTMERVHQIMTKLYSNSPDGISGNEDCGQMSAWYVFSAMGFYPVTPGTNTYIIGTPLIDKATINLENGKQFTIKAHNRSDTNIYIESTRLNGAYLDGSYITHESIIDGGVLEFFMTDNPAIWMSRDGDQPTTEITEHLIVPAPFIKSGDIAFKDQTTVALGHIDAQASIFYSLNEAPFKAYSDPFIIREAATLEVYAQKENEKSSNVTTRFYKIDPNRTILLKTKYANQYNAGGNNALIDGILGTRDFRTGTWQGYQNEDVGAIINLGNPKSLKSIKVNFLQDQRSWIFLPTEVEISISDNGIDFKPVSTTSIDASVQDETITIKTIEYKTADKPIQYIRLKAQTLGDLPEWHLGHKYDGKSWIFIDEIQIEENQQ